MKRIVRRALILLCVVVTGLFTALGLVGCETKVAENLLPNDPTPPPHEHTYGETWEHDKDGHWQVCTDESCKQAQDKTAHGYPESFEQDEDGHWKVCTTCAYVQEKVAHTYGAGVKKSDSSCTVRGETEFTCTDCGYVHIEYAPFVHNYEDYNTILPTCTSKGYTIQRCTECYDEIRTNPTDETGHSYTPSVQAATCITPEITTYSCGGCGDSYVEITAPATGHNLEGATWTVASETLVSGSQCMYTVTEETTCTVANCSAKITRTLADPIHKGNYTSTITKQANCTEPGEIKYTCSCGNAEYEYTSNYEGNAHNWNDGEEKNGMIVYTCTHNSAHTKQEVSATKDSTTSSATIPATALQNLQTTTSAEVEVTDNTKMQMDTNVLSAITGTDATDVKLIAEELDASQLPTGISTARVGDTVYNFDLQDAEGNSLFGEDNTTGGKITITVPYQLKEGEDPATITILWLNDDGSTVAVPARYSYDDQNGGMVSFELEHFSYYTVVRMTGEEICAREKKHIEKVTVVPNTCTQAGYTVTICTRCNKTWQSNQQPALGHLYTQTTVEPTCTERGYTRHVCQRAGCNDSYVSDYTPQIAHEYQDNVIAPTCTEKGLTAHTCVHCGKTYRDSYVVPNGHTYRNGNCKDCGERDLTHLVNADNFYFNLIDSVINADGFYIEVEDIQMHGSMHSEEMSGEVDYEMDMYRFTFKVDENGYIVGQGEGKMKATMTSTMTERTEEGAPPQTRTETEKFDMEMIVVFQDGNIYMFQKETEQIGDFISKSDWYILEEQEDMGLDDLRETYATLEQDNLLAIIGGVMGKENNPLNTAMANVVGYLFDKTETADGFSYVLNYAKLPEIYTAITEDSVSVLFDKIFDEDTTDEVSPFAKASEYVLGLPAKTVGAFKGDIVDFCLDFGVELADVFAVIDQVMVAMGNEGFNISQMIADRNDQTLAQVVSESMGEEMTVEDCQGMIQGVLDMLSETTLADFAIMAGMSGGGNQEGGMSPNPQPQPNPESKTEPMSGELEGEEGETGEEGEEDEMQQMIVSFMAYLSDEITSLVESLTGKSAMGFTTDKKGNLMTVSVSFENLTHSLTVSPSMFGEDMSDMDIEVQLNGNATMFVNGSYVADYDEIVTALERSKTLFNIQNELELVEKEISTDSEGNEEYRYYEYVMIPTEQGTLVVKKFNENYGNSSEHNYNDSYNGTPCYSYVSETLEMAYFISDITSIQFKNSCNGWKQYNIMANYMNQTVYKVYYLQNGERLAVVPMIDRILEYLDKSDYHMFTIYYNAGLNEYSMTDPHNYVLVAKDLPTHCEDDGYAEYRCTACGHQKREHFYKWHENTEWRFELADGAERCEDGLLEVMYCYDCEQNVHTWELSEERAKEHPTWREKVELFGATANTCEEHVLVHNVCACGENDRYYMETKGPDTFGEPIKEFGIADGKEEHRVYVYRCSVTACAYTYAREIYCVENTADCTRTWHYTIYYGVENLPDEPTEAPTDYAKEISYSETNEWHDTAFTTTWNGNIKTDTQECKNCEKTTVLQKWECFGVQTQTDPGKSETYYTYSACREIYWFSYTNGHGTRYEYDEYCNRTYYNLYWDEEKQAIVENEGWQDGTGHCTSRETLVQPTCTQFGMAKEECYACGYELTYHCNPRGHRYNGSYCNECGMGNQTESDGAFVMEDMTANGTIKVGYYNRYNRNYDILVFFNYGKESQIRVDTESWGSLIEQSITRRSVEEAREDYEYGYYPWGLECGTIALNMQTLEQIMSEQNVALETLTIVISSSYNYEAEGGNEERALEYGVTFEIGKSGTYALNTFFDEGTAYALGDVWNEVVLAKDTATLVLNADFTYTLTLDGALYGDEVDHVYTGDWQAQGEELILKYDDSRGRIYCDGDEVRFGPNSYNDEYRSYVLTKQA